MKQPLISSNPCLPTEVEITNLDNVMLYQRCKYTEGTDSILIDPSQLDQLIDLLTAHRDSLKEGNNDSNG